MLLLVDIGVAIFVYNLLMINNIFLVQCLKNMGYTQDEANRLVAKHLSNGTIDELETYINRNRTPVSTK